MKKVSILALTLLAAVSARAQTGYTQVNLDSDIPGMALQTDSKLVNPWGLSRPASPQYKEAHWWASDQVTGVTTLYDANGTVVPLTVTIPPASGTGAGSPTGTVAIGVNFIFATSDGTISEWPAAAGNNGATLPAGFAHPDAGKGCAGCHITTAIVKVNNSSVGTVYTGATVAAYNGVSTLYVAKTNAGAGSGVEAYDANFTPIALGANAFTDPKIPAGFTPYGIQGIGKRVYVTYAPPPPASGGYVDAFDSSGNLLLTLQQGSWFDGPWGVAQAPSNFGTFSSRLLVGNVGSGEIAAFNASNGKFLGYVSDSNGKPLSNPGLWALSFGNGNTESGPTNTLYFNAGIQNFTHGLFGAITAN